MLGIITLYIVEMAVLIIELLVLTPITPPPRGELVTKLDLPEPVISTFLVASGGSAGQVGENS